MKNYTRLTLERGVDMESQCRYRYVFGANDIFYPHCHEFYEIFITVKGVVTHLVNGIQTKLPEGSLLFIRPDDIHAFVYDEPESAKTEYVNLAFSPETANQLFEYLSNDFPASHLLCCDMPPTITLAKSTKKRLLSQISELNTLNWENKKALKIRMRVILAEVFSQFFYEINSSNRKSDIPLWLLHTVRDMEQPKNFIAGADRMIELSQKSHEHLSRSMKRYYGTSVTEYINELRINYAANLLINTDNSIIDICFICGFQNLGYFYKIFNKRYSVPPRKFRMQHQNEY